MQWLPGGMWSMTGCTPCRRTVAALNSVAPSSGVGKIPFPRTTDAALSNLNDPLHPWHFAGAAHGTGERMLEAIPLVRPVEMRIDLQDGDGAKWLEPREEWNGNRVIPAEQQGHGARTAFRMLTVVDDQRAVLLRCCRIGWKVAKINRRNPSGIKGPS
ncbi:hypothetical protein ABIF68_003960 [Bradyrhizobium japonicum]